MNKSNYPNLDFICSSGNFAPGTKFNPKALSEEFEELLQLAKEVTNVHLANSILQDRLYDTECLVTDLKDEIRALKAAAQGPNYYDINNFYPM